MTTKKYSIITLISVVTLVFILIYTFCVGPTKAYADEITEATVENSNSTNTDSTTTITGADTSTTVSQDSNNAVQASKAPVSIAVYSDEVTESSDTYDYSKKIPNASLPVVENDPVVTTQVPDAGIEPTPAPVTPENPDTSVTTRDPSSTAAPDATPEPDIISYPPTVAPAYKD